MAYQTVKLMPEEDWNASKPGGENQHGGRDKPAEGIIQDNLHRLVAEEVARLQGVSATQPFRKTTDLSSAAIEHHAIDNMDLAAYKPLSCNYDR